MKTTLGFIWGIIFFEILMITLVSSLKQPFYTILHTTVSPVDIGEETPLHIVILIRKKLHTADISHTT